MEVLLRILSAVPYVFLLSTMILLEKRNTKLSHQVKEKDHQILPLKMRISQLLLSKNVTCQISKQMSPDLIEAVKFAMTQAHPDNPNGDNEKFIRFHKVYENIKD